MTAVVSGAPEQPVSVPVPAPDAPVASAQVRQSRSVLRAFSSLRQRNYRLYWLGKLVSFTGSYMQILGQAWLVLQLTHSAFRLGLVGALEALPVLLFSLVGGVLADRWPRRRVLLCHRTAAMAQAALFWILVVTGSIQLWQVYALALSLGLMDALGRPASHAFIVELVGPADLPNALALNSLLSNVTRMLGPGLGGIIIASGGLSMLFLLNALSFIASIVGLALIDPRTLHSQPARPANAGVRETPWQSLRAGVTYVWRTPAVSLVLVVAGLVLLFGSNFNVVLPFFATAVLHAGARGFGFLSASAGAGALVAALWLAWSNRRPTVRGVLAGALGFALLEAVFALSRFYLLSLVLIALVGGAELLFAMLALTLVQTLAPDDLRGRVMSVCVVCFDGSLPLGSLLLGWMIVRYGAPNALLIAALLSLLVAGAGCVWRPIRWR
jgi:MFS family permease